MSTVVIVIGFFAAAGVIGYACWWQIDGKQLDKKKEQVARVRAAMAQGGNTMNVPIVVGAQPFGRSDQGNYISHEVENQGMQPQYGVAINMPPGQQQFAPPQQQFAPQQQQFDPQMQYVQQQQQQPMQPPAYYAEPQPPMAQANFAPPDKNQY